MESVWILVPNIQIIDNNYQDLKDYTMQYYILTGIASLKQININKKMRGVKLFSKVWSL